MRPDMPAAVASIVGKGRGVVAERAIAAGEIIDRAWTIELSGADCDVISQSVVDHYYFAHPASEDMGLLVLGLASLANHSDDPNAQVDWQVVPGAGWVGHLVAVRPIAAGEEITRRYACAPWFQSAAWSRIDAVGASGHGSGDMAHARLAETIAVLERLVAFKSLPGRPNLDLVGYLRDYLADKGIEGRLSFDDSGTRANIHALIGPPVDGGVVLNGHTDVVPVEGQAWTSDPFGLVRRDGRLFARGAVDMKGFLACIFASAAMLRDSPLERPVHLTACYDEEIGGLGAPILVEAMLADGSKPAVAIVGEPTAMRLVSGHKGGLEMHTEFLGHAGHASDPRKGVNAIHFAARFVARLTEMAADLSRRPRAGSPYEPPYSTISVGRISGGAARNIIADSCAIDWELRPLPGDDGDAMIAEIERFSREELLPEMRKVHPKADIRTVTEARVPALDEAEAAAAVALVSEITGSNATEVVSFGTDAGHFCRAGISTVVFGPGSIGEAHKPDEFIEVSEIEACLAFLDRLALRLSRP